MSQGFIGKGRLKPDRPRRRWGPRPKLDLTKEELVWLILHTNLVVGPDRLKRFVERVRQVA